MTTKKLESRVEALEVGLKRLEEQTNFIKDMLILLQNRSMESMVGMVNSKRQSHRVQDTSDDLGASDVSSDHDLKEAEIQHPQNQVTLNNTPKQHHQPIKLCGHVKLSRRVA